MFNQLYIIAKVFSFLDDSDQSTLVLLFVSHGWMEQSIGIMKFDNSTWFDLIKIKGPLAHGLDGFSYKSSNMRWNILQWINNVLLFSSDKSYRLYFIIYVFVCDKYQKNFQQFKTHGTLRLPVRRRCCSLYTVYCLCINSISNWKLETIYFHFLFCSSYPNLDGWLLNGIPSYIFSEAKGKK